MAGMVDLTVSVGLVYLFGLVDLADFVEKMSLARCHVHSFEQCHVLL